MVKSERTGQAGSRRGVALILVLGMLALMLIMATSFSVMMRTEHAGAGNFADETRSRHVVWAALAESIARIEANTGPTQIYPAWTALGPQGTNVTRSAGTAQVAIVWGEAGDYVPNKLYDFAEDAWSEWVVDPTSGARYSYLVLNCSGLLDGNYAGGSNRTAGVHPNEIQVEQLADVYNLSRFKNRRDRDVRYESLREFNLLQGTNSTPAGGLDGDYSDNFIIGTHYPRGWWSGIPSDAVVEDRMYIGDPEDNAFDRDQFMQRLEAACGENLDDDFMYDQLVDYVDTDSVPRRLDTACTELVPMFNEVQLYRYRFRSDRVQYQVSTEWIFPFLKPANHSFHIEQEVTADVYTNGVSGWVQVVSQATDGGTVDSGYNTETNFIERVRGPMFDIPMPQPIAGEVRLDVWVRLKMRIDSDTGDIVDQVPVPWGGGPTDGFAFSVTNDVGQQDLPASSYEVIDPRFNWDANEWIEQQGTQSMGDVNIATTEHFDDIIARGAQRITYDRDAIMHVSDAGHLRSVAELGHLLRDGTRMARSRYYWTIRAYSLGAGDFDDLHRYFTVRNTRSVPGLVNVNTPYEDVLRAAITNMPMGCPENPNRIEGTDLDTIVDKIVWDSSRTNLFSLSNLCRKQWRNPTMLPEWSEVERDAFLAQIEGLVGTRNNLFTILLMGGPATQGMGLTGTQEQGWFGMRRAVAVVWRDPFPIVDSASRRPVSPLRHRYVLRYFNWLDN